MSKSSSDKHEEPRETTRKNQEKATECPICSGKLPTPGGKCPSCG